MMFSNHLMALIKRIYKKELVDLPIDDEMMKGISKKAWEYAEIIIKGLFHEAGLSINNSELFLVATYMQMVLEKE